MSDEKVMEVAASHQRAVITVPGQIKIVDEKYTILEGEEFINLRVAPDEYTPQEGETFVEIMSGHGDYKLIWNRRKDDEVEEAESTFNRLRKKRYLAFSVDEEGNKGKQIDKFDANAERMILAPPMVGG